MASDPTGYYVGPPMNFDDQKAPDPPAKKAVDEQFNASVPNIPGYYRGRVGQAAGDQTSAAATQHNGNGESFLAKLKRLMCFSSGGNGR